MIQCLENQPWDYRLVLCDGERKYKVAAPVVVCKDREVLVELTLIEAPK